MAEPLTIAVVGHTNAGKTSLLRTLTRRVDFGDVSDRPGTTRHAEAIALRLEGRVLARFIDTPGLEDAVALQEYLQRLEGESEHAQLQGFLRGPEAHAAFEQEAKVVRALLEQADCAMLVIDTREPVLPKYRAEMRILIACARPILPVLNFVRDAASRQAEWHRMLRESGLHARVEFDAVAPFIGSEQQLYSDLATLLPTHRERLQEIGSSLAAEARDRRAAACRVVADALVDVAAMRRALPAAEFARQDRQQAFVQAFRDEVRRHARRAVDALLALYGFRPGDAELADMPELAGRWADDLFNTELLLQAGKRLGLGAMIGAGVGAVADVALAGLSLGAATTLGATVGGAVSGGWRPLWRKLENRLTGVQELTVEDPVLVLMAGHLLQLVRALALRGHAAQETLRVTADPAPDAAGDMRVAIGLLGSARGHPEWERGSPGALDDEGRAELHTALARQLLDRLTDAPGAAPPALPGAG
ncbi:MAG TPA: GTPase/DUF3482 domain-containing protein [Ottowia sp.]|uniref:GTPase/DUF3482 domain-containing protein n=1 Tax=Ottowia sp. TaxID=1898956 RepID=UPI002B691117|nr:GTPase/DUF3482 domain-containing protein [Ottowia sp.]HMN20652.1 GTPase/DUF3482 domain-containing protein [Ottowia sp.]